MMQKIKITCSSLTSLAEEISSLGDELNTKCLEFEELLDSYPIFRKDTKALDYLEVYNLYDSSISDDYYFNKTKIKK